MSRSRRWTSIQKTALRNRGEIIEARPKLSRRELFKLGLLTSSGYLVAKHGLSARVADAAPVSPQTTAWAVEMPRIPVAEPVPLLLPVPMKDPVPGEARRVPHQRWEQFLPVKYFEQHEKPGMHKFVGDVDLEAIPEQEIWGFEGIFPGPTFHARYGEPIIVRRFNELPPNHKGFGMPEVTTHLHNGHTPSESDGFPADFFAPGFFYDQHYPNIRAGYDAFPPFGDIRETLATLWYHDHRFDFTSQNVYKGLAGFYLLFSENDTGDETSPLPMPVNGLQVNRANLLAFQLPSGEFDIPILFADKLFDEDGQLVFDLFSLDGILGDKITVNGVIQPFLKVARRKYRLRLLNVGPSRFYQFSLSNFAPLICIANDGNLLPHPVNVQSVLVSVAERVDVIVDFSNVPIGQSVFLLNRLEQISGTGPTGNLLPASSTDPVVRVLRFDVDRDAPDPSKVPMVFYDLPPVPPPSGFAQTRIWNFERLQGAWAINGKFFDPGEIRAEPKQGTAEKWVLRNNSGGWQHPIHIHFEEFQILSRNGQPPAPHEAGRKDVVRLRQNEEIQLFLRFRDFRGRFPMHCHNTVHEDHAMMIRWDIVP